MFSNCPVTGGARGSRRAEKMKIAADPDGAKLVSADAAYAIFSYMGLDDELTTKRNLNVSGKNWDAVVHSSHIRCAAKPVGKGGGGMETAAFSY